MIGRQFDIAGRERSVSEKLWDVSWPLIVVCSGVMGVGILTLYSSAGGAFAPWADRQLIRFVIGLGLMFALALVPLRILAGLAWPAYAVGLGLLIVVLVFGQSAMGARRWLQIGPLTLQPSEFIKLGVIVLLARYYQGLPVDRISRPTYVIIPLILILVPVALVIKQPDLGSALLLLILGLAIMILAGVNPAYFGAAGAGSVFAAPMIWERLHDYQKKRVLVFLNPDQDLLGAGYHIQQSKIALGAGGASGKGFLQGTQSAMNFLPEKHTDFIFAVFGEEMGFSGSVALLLLFAVLLVVLLSMALRCRSQFARLLIGGVGLMIFTHMFINIAMVIGLVPVVGVPLPLVSYGGTALISTMIGLGLAMCAFVNRTQTGRPELYTLLRWTTS